MTRALRDYEWITAGFALLMILVIFAADGARLEATGFAAITMSALLGAPGLAFAWMSKRPGRRRAFSGLVPTLARSVTWPVVGLGAFAAGAGIFQIYRDAAGGEVLLAIGLTFLFIGYCLMALAYIGRQLHGALTAMTSLTSDERLAGAGLLFIIGSALEFLAFLL